MQPVDLLSETLDETIKTFEQSERGPTFVRRFGVCLYTAELSVREPVTTRIDRVHSFWWSTTVVSDQINCLTGERQPRGFRTREYRYYKL